MAETMLQLGPYRFSLDTAAYQDLSRAVEYRWAAQSRVGTFDALQFTGFGGETIDLRGVIHPQFRGGSSQPDRMRLTASIGVPLPLISGRGRILGLWVITSVRESQGIFARRGAPKVQFFDISLRRYDGGLRSLVPI